MTDVKKTGDIGSWKCRCGNSKPQKSSFCSRCHFALPLDVRTKLYRSPDQGYAEAYAAACELLDATSKGTNPVPEDSSI